MQNSFFEFCNKPGKQLARVLSDACTLCPSPYILRADGTKAVTSAEKLQVFEGFYTNLYSHVFPQ